MVQSSYGTEGSILSQIHEGMEVYDREGQKVGTVEHVQFGDEDPTNPGVETRTAQNPELLNNSLVENLAEALAGTNDVPEVVRARLLRYGFIKVDTGLLSSDRYIMPDQIAHVAEDRVHLLVLHKDLLKL